MPRERLPDRRAGIAFEFEHVAPSGIAYKYSASVGFYNDGRIGEIFLSCGRSGTDVDISTRDAAIAMSLALQAGCEFEVLAGAFLRRENDSPDGPLGTLCRIIAGDESVRRISAELAEALVAREVPPIVEDLGIVMAESPLFDQREFVDLPGELPMEREAVRETEASQIRDLIDRSREAVLRGYVSEACPDCKNYTLVRNGTCLKCDTCGATTGCS